MYDFILFENFRSATNHLYDLHLIARMLQFKDFSVAILNIYGSETENNDNIPIIQIPFLKEAPNDEFWINCKRNGIKRLFYVCRFLWQQRTYMKKVRRFIVDKGKSFYCGSYHLLMPGTFFSLDKPCYYWGLRSSRMTGFGKLLGHNPFLAFRMLYLKHLFMINPNQHLFVSNEIIKNEFLQLGIPENRLIIREERCVDSVNTDNSQHKDQDFSLLVIGGLRKQKHVETTIRAFKGANIRSSVLRLVGENKDIDYEGLIMKEIGSCENIERVNRRLQYDEFNHYFKRAHFTLFADEKGDSSVTNGTMMESLINMTPIIAPNHLPYSLYIEKYDVGLLYDPDSVLSYSDTINKANSLGFEYFVPNIRKFLKTLQFDYVADSLFEQIVKHNY